MGGLIGLLDDIAALAKLTAASLDDVSSAAGCATAERELPIGQGQEERAGGEPQQADHDD